MLSWLFPNTYGEERRCALGRESIDKLMQITGKAAILAAALTGKAAILAAHEYAFYPFGSSTLTSAATMESPSPIAIGLPIARQIDQAVLHDFADFTPK